MLQRYRRNASGLPVTHYFPPNAANDHEDGEVDHAHDEACFPPFAQGGVAGTENHGRSAGGVVGKGHHDAGRGGQQQGVEHGGAHPEPGRRHRRR